MTKTPNYSLPQWDLTDPVRMSDFNDLTSKVDAALAKKSELVIGTYTGDGQETQTIVLGFKPKAVLIFNQHGRASYISGNISYYAGGLAVEGGPVVSETYSGKAYNAVELTETGFAVHWKSISTQSNTHYVSANTSNKEYRYIAIA